MSPPTGACPATPTSWDSPSRAPAQGLRQRECAEEVHRRHQEGYDYALANPDKAADILVEQAKEAQLDSKLTRTSMEEIAKNNYWTTDDPKSLPGTTNFDDAQPYLEFQYKAGTYKDQDGNDPASAPQAKDLATNEYVAEPAAASPAAANLATVQRIREHRFVTAGRATPLPFGPSRDGTEGSFPTLVTIPGRFSLLPGPSPSANPPARQPPSIPSLRFHIVRRSRHAHTEIPVRTRRAAGGHGRRAAHRMGDRRGRGATSPQRALASPSQIAASIIKTWPDLWEATAITTYEAITGFLIAAVAGVLIGIGLYVSKTLYRGIYPLLAAAQTIPLITIAPLFMIWFGFEPLGKIVIVAVFGVFPVAVQTCRGMLAVPQFYEDVALTCGATRAWALWHVKLRVAARQVFGGLRISAAYMFGTAVTAEYLAR